MKLVSFSKTALGAQDARIGLVVNDRGFRPTNTSARMAALVECGMARLLHWVRDAPV